MPKNYLCLPALDALGCGTNYMGWAGYGKFLYDTVGVGSVRGILGGYWVFVMAVLF